MKTIKPLIFFLLINFGGLFLGSWLMNNGPRSSWYINLNQAPWTPDGWVFGVAWSTIMVCFPIYLSYLYTKKNNSKLLLTFALQLILNVSWNYIFFNQHLVLFGLIIITFLTLLIFYFFFTYKNKLNYLSYLLLPYMVWMLIATSLNAYVFINN